MTRLIDADVLKKTFENLASDDYNEPIWYQQTVFETIENAPTVDAIPNEEGYEMYNKGYMSGYEICKKDVIRSIAKQYSEHNELVPSWLHIGKMEEVDND